MVVNRQNSQWPEPLYQQLRQSGASLLQFIPLVERDERGMLTAESVEPQVWGTFLTAVFDIWVREDIGRIHIRLFDIVLNVWCGYSRYEEKRRSALTVSAAQYFVFVMEIVQNITMRGEKCAVRWIQ